MNIKVLGSQSANVIDDLQASKKTTYSSDKIIKLIIESTTHNPTGTITIVETVMTDGSEAFFVEADDSDQFNRKYIAYIPKSITESSVIDMVSTHNTDKNAHQNMIIDGGEVV